MLVFTKIVEVKKMSEKIFASALIIVLSGAVTTMALSIFEDVRDDPDHSLLAFSFCFSTIIISTILFLVAIWIK
jgi:hypothetical protein